MKIRQSFVTNSSSSSFIVMFDNVPETKEELQVMLFGDAETHCKYDYTFPTAQIAERVWNDMQEENEGWIRYDGDDLSEEEKAENEECSKPWFSFKRKGVWDIAIELEYGNIDGAPELYYHRPGEPDTSYSDDPVYNERYRLEEKQKYIMEDGSKIYFEQCNYELHEKDCRRWAFEKAEELFDKNPETSFFIFSYADGDGSLDCVMEHGGIFDKLGKDKIIKISHH